ncbi:hypothetical protein [Priestia filamentosa]|uniref:hypothetical protein n=1 Tax=Priestia filamentosa TaxID=1402861 RepID=UPI00397D691F
MCKDKRIKSIVWSIILPGLAQLLNKKVIKGSILIAFKFLIDVKTNLSGVIFLSFQGEIEEAIKITNYPWLLFYPCLYFFAMWDAFKDAGGGKGRYSFLPFVFCAYFVTVGCMYSSHVRLFGILFGPVWLPILFVVPGVVTGVLLDKFITSLDKKSNVS